MARYLPHIFLGVIALAGIGAHITACGLHAAAVEQMWRDPIKQTKYVWSHAYCKFVSAPFAPKGN